MEFGGRYLFASSRLSLWQALNDTDVLRAAIPGCDAIRWVGPDALEASISVNLGIARPVFTGDLLLSDVRPAERYTLTGRGRGGLLGLAHGAADIELSDAEAGAMLWFQASGGASGQIMRLGKSLIGSRAQGVIDGFFARIGTAMGTTVTPVPESGPSEPDPAPLSTRIDPT